ncbi:MAG: hypothetical protein QG641_1024 [Candidatus Poribacteria bacterium]|nr:hypothetical protein [Candidatus Poribacteria bacterium]
MKEEEIRPQKLFDELLRLNREDISIYFSNANREKINCPACNEKGVYSFTKDGFDFDECEKCKSLYVSPRPEKSAFENYYTDSQSTKFWATTFYKATQENRREMLWKPKAKLIHTVLQKFSSDVETIVDIGGGYGVFMEEYLKIHTLNHLVIEPSKFLSSICREKNLNVNEKFLEDIQQNELPNGKKVYVSFELFEHLHTPKLFLTTLYSLMKQGDLFIFTTLSGMGIDIQTLWENSKSISPPMHLNFLNPKSVRILLENLGFEVLEVTTPGKLDINIMGNNITKLKDKFWKNFLEYSDDLEKEKMQLFVSEQKLSSHMMITCKKK